MHLLLSSAGASAMADGSRIKPWALTKTFLVMKLTAILLLAAVIQVSAKGTAQTVTYSAESEPLSKVFSVIEEQSGYVFFYRKADLKDLPLISISLKDADIKTALSVVLNSYPLNYEIENKTVIISKKIPAGHLSTALIMSSLTTPPVTGVVRDANGNPIAGVNIVIKGTKRGTVTKEDGSFSIEANEGEVLVISNIGFAERVITVGGNETVGIVELAKSDSKLDEVQVIAYGTTTNRLNTGNVASVKSNEISQQPVSNPLLALQGRVPGLSVSQASGLPGSGIQILIQGQNSILNGNEPFFVIDGVPYASQLLPNYGVMLGRTESAGLTGARNNGNPLNFINPQDIESIEVLKDADATSIYGSRAANGAILITTKKGKSGRTSVSLQMEKGWGKVARRLKMITAEQYLQMRKEAYVNDGLPVPTANVPDAEKTPLNYDLTFWDKNPVTDWQKQLIGNTANYTNISASVGGGNNNIKYLLSGGYHLETTVFPTTFNDKKGSVHFSLNNISENKKFNLQFTANYIVDRNLLPNHDLTAEALYLSPFAPSLYNSDGSLNWMPNQDGISTWQNPLAYTYEKYSNNTSNLIANGILKYKLFDGLDISSSFGYNNLASNEIQTFPLIAKKPETRINETRIGQYGNNQISTWIIEPQASYKKALTKNSGLEVLVGSTFQQTNKKGLLQYGYGFNSDLVIEDILSAPFTGITSSTISQYNYAALFGRINYNFQNRYIINISGRRDGSSRFGEKNKFHNFGSLGTAWIFSEEAFVKNNIRFLSFGKLRLSYGTTGNDQIGDYRYISLYNPMAVEVPYQGTAGLEVTNLSNPFLQWEETKKLNIGLDIGLLNDRILATGNYFIYRSANQLVGYPLPSITGFTSIDANLPAVVQNDGIEISFNTINIKRRDFTWTSSFNITVPRNKLVEFPGLATSPYSYDYELGQPVYRIKVYKLSGVNPSTGVYEFIDKDGKPTSTPNSTNDRIVSIETTPKFFGGFQNSVRYRNFQMDFHFQFVKQTGQTYALGRRPGRFAGGYGNQPIYVLDRWQKEGDVANNQRFSYNNFGTIFSNAANNSDAGYGDASFVRLKNVSISYTVPHAWIKAANRGTIVLFLHAQNLLTFTNYKGLDPETKNTTGLPPLRIISAGLKAEL